MAASFRYDRALKRREPRTIDERLAPISTAAAATAAAATPNRRELRGSFIKLEDMSGKYRAVWKECPLGVNGFPALRFDGAWVCMHLLAIRIHVLLMVFCF